MRPLPGPFAQVTDALIARRTRRSVSRECAPPVTDQPEQDSDQRHPDDRACHEQTSVDVVIVGAGISGLAVADALTRLGMDVAVLEARHRTGGRLLSTPLDLGATWFWDGERRVRALTERFGVATFSQHLVGDTIVEDLSGVQRYAGNMIDAPSYRYAGGAATLTDALAASLPAGTLRLDHPVERISLVAASITPSQAPTVDVTARGRTWRAPHVVLAVPPAIAVDTIELPAELPPELSRLAAATPVWMGQVVKIVAVYDEPFWRRDGLAGAAASRRGPMQEIHDMSGPEGHPAALFGFAPAALIDADADRAVRDQLTRMFGPQASDPLHITVANWSTEKWTSPAPRVADSGATGPAPIDYGLFGHPNYQQPGLDGRLHWAATETATAYPGHVEGALEAAERVVADIRTGLLDRTTDGPTSSASEDTRTAPTRAVHESATSCGTVPG